LNSPRVLALVGDENGPAMWRTWQPMKLLQEQGHVTEWDYLDRASEVFPLVARGVFEAVILPRLSWSSENYAISRNWIDSLHRAGVCTIYEVDDDIFSPQIAARQHATTERDKSLEQLEAERRDRIVALRLCDGVTVSSERLARVVRQYVDVDVPVCVVPNSIDIRWWRSTVRGVRRSIPPLTIGWAGGNRYSEDFSELAQAWGAIARRYPDVRFVVQGYQGKVLEEHVPAERFQALPWLPLDKYPQALLNIDIGCANVVDNHFNRCKTPIKLWEYTLSGAVSVVSPALYGPVTTDGEDGLVAETAAEWESALARLIEDAALRKRLWRAQRRRVAEHHALAKNALRWLEAWSTCIQAYRQKAARPKLLLAS
jgi:glycosyltransferase involved in cell wall biosynthesis